MEIYSLLNSNSSRLCKYCKSSFGSIFYNLSHLNSLISVFLLLGICLMTPVHSAKWVEVDEGTDSGDTYLWPYFYSASRFVDIESINKKDGYIIYRELVNSQKSMSNNVLSLIAEKKSGCDGQKVLWKHFAIYRSGMGEGKPITRLNPNEMQDLKKGSGAYISDSFACNFEK